MKFETIELPKVIGARIELNAGSLRTLRTALNTLYCPGRELMELRAQLDILFNQGVI